MCGALPALEHEDQLMLGAVEAAHAGIGLVPDAEVLQLAVVRLGRPQQLADMAPVHAEKWIAPSLLCADQVSKHRLRGRR